MRVLLIKVSMTNKKNNLYEYLDFVKLAKLDCKSKALLYFYAISYNWSHNKPSWYSQRAICALTAMAPSTYHSVQKKLEQLGWIRTNYRGRDKTVQVWVSVGDSDPEYDTYSWSTFHPFNLEGQISENYEHDPFEHRDRQETPFHSPSVGPSVSYQEEDDPDTWDEEKAAKEAFWKAFEDPQTSISAFRPRERRSSECEFDDLASDLWGV